MKFRTLPLAALVALCALSSTSCAHETVEELYTKMMHLVCPPGKKAAIVRQFCPPSARNPLDCRPTHVECVQQSFGNNQGQVVTVSENKRTNPAPKTEEELDYEFHHMQCPVGERPAKTLSICPTGAKDPRDCSPIQVKCVKISFWNSWGSKMAPTVSTSPPTPQQTEEELDREMAHKACPFGQRPHKVQRSCASDAKDAINCGRITIMCVRDHFGNVWGGTELTAVNSMPPPKTEEELDREMAHAECPFGQRPAKISPLCPTGAKATHDCPPVEVACVQKVFGNNPGSTESPGRGPTAGSSPKTEKELEREMVLKKCIFGQRPAKISPWCPTGAKDTQDCAYTEVWCVKDLFGNNPGSTDLASSAPARSPETVDQLRKDMVDMICPDNHQPSLIEGLCPTGSELSTGCANSRIACRPQTLVGDQTQENRQRFMSTVDKIMRVQQSDPRWFASNHDMKLFAPYQN